MTYDVVIEGKSYRLELEREGDTYRGQLDGTPVRLDAILARPDVISLIVDGKSYEVKRELTPRDLHLWIKGARYAVEVRDPRSLQSRRAGREPAAGPRKLIAPMPGKVVRLLIKEKDRVEAGQGMVVIEAMKMQNELKSPKQGTVQKLCASEGSLVNAGDVLAVVE
jgi:biotin carboxyl carrier protein